MKNTTPIPLGDELKRIRKQLKLSQSQFAEKYGVSSRRLSTLETEGANERVNAKTNEGLLKAWRDAEAIRLKNAEENMSTEKIESLRRQIIAGVQALSPRGVIRKHAQFMELVSASLGDDYSNPRPLHSMRPGSIPRPRPEGPGEIDV